MTELQNQLKAAGFDPGSVDGIFGPKTAAALKGYQKANGLSVDGIYGPKSKASLTGTSAKPNDTKSVGDSPTGARMSLAGEPELWKVGDQSWIVHKTTGVNGEVITLAWLAPSDEDVQSFFGPDKEIIYDKTLDVMPDDVLDEWGTTDELANLTDDPITTWRNTLETQAKTQPWLLDADYQALSLMAVLEGRPLTEAEIDGTDWYQNSSIEERAWERLFNSDPTTAQRAIDDGRTRMRETLKNAGINNASDDLINFLADAGTQGTWTPAYLASQMQALADPASGLTVDSALKSFVGGLDTTQEGEGDVRKLIKQWLGPNFGNWDDEVISEWAGKLRNDPDAQLALVETLKDQKLSLFPDTDREATYQTIAAPWKQFVTNMWGTQIDETDPLFLDIIRMNNAGEAGQALTKEGLNRGNDTVVNSVQGALTNTFGSI